VSEVGPFKTGEVHHADCLDGMRQMPDACVTAIVTDPPYGLSSGKTKYIGDEGATGGFMGKEWDHGVPGVAFWKEALRVAKPGAPLLAFGGDRIHHRLMVAIEDAGWEIRTCIYWIFGSGFPKSHNIGKGIEKIRVGGIRNLKQIGVKKGIKVESGTQGFSYSKEYVPGKSMGGKQITGDIPVYEINNDWEGWGTALKPAAEIIVFAMKPLDKNFANNALKHGVAGINIDGCRIGTTGGSTTPSGMDRYNASNASKGYRPSEYQQGEPPAPKQSGRWPANVVLQHHPDCIQNGMKKVKGSRPPTPFTESDTTGDIYGKYAKRSQVQHADEDGTETVEDWDCHPDCPTQLFPETKSGKLSPHHELKGSENTSMSGPNQARNPRQEFGDDSGSAARFFYCCQPNKTDMGTCQTRFRYCAKASKAERGPTNNHATVKPLDLMKWLVTLVTMPSENLVLDPFSGSGTTGLACEVLKVPFIGFEKEEQSVKVSNRRIRSVMYGDVSIKEHKAGQMSLFEDIE